MKAKKRPVYDPEAIAAAVNKEFIEEERARLEKSGMT